MPARRPRRPRPPLPRWVSRPCGQARRASPRGRRGRSASVTLVVGGVRPGEAEVRRDGRGEDVRLVVDDRHVPPDLLDGRARGRRRRRRCSRPRLGSRWRASDGEERALARAVGPDDGDPLPGLERRSVGGELLARARSTTPRPRASSTRCRRRRGCRRPGSASSVTAGSWSSRASSRALLPWARARERMVSTSGARASPTATGTTTSSAATGAPVVAGSARQAAARVATAVATSRAAATRRARGSAGAPPGAGSRGPRRASRPAVASAPIACSSPAWRATRSLTRRTSARDCSSSSRDRDSSSQASQHVTAMASEQPQRATSPTAGANHAASTAATSPARRSTAPARSPAPGPRRRR